MTTGAITSAGGVYATRRRCDTGPLVIDGVRSDLIAGLRDLILRMKKGSTGSAGTFNVGGWKSDEGLFVKHRDDPGIAALRHAIGEAIGDLGVVPVGWAMINKRGSFHRRHAHRSAIVSGVYYVDPGDPPAPTLFEDPANAHAAKPITVDAVAGRLALFRGDLPHWVPEYLGDEPRITIAFDIRR